MWVKFEAFILTKFQEGGLHEFVLCEEKEGVDNNGMSVWIFFLSSLIFFACLFVCFYCICGQYNCYWYTFEKTKTKKHDQTSF